MNKNDKYFIYENWQAENKAVVHISSCGHAREGHNRLNDYTAPNDRWFGYFETLHEAIAFASLLPNRQLKLFGHCLRQGPISIFKNKITKKILFFLILAFAVDVNAQSFNEDKTTFSNFLKRMYTATPFEGVKIIDDYDHQYLVSIISLDKAKYSDPSIMNRVAQVKAQSQANTFLNSASISMDMVIKTSEKTTSNSNTTLVETIESIKQNSTGFTQGLELLTNFDNADSKRLVFIYMREIIKEKK